MKYLFLCLAILAGSCNTLKPGKLSRLPSNLSMVRDSAHIMLGSSAGKTLEAVYLGCGGFYLKNGASSILIDPFFSNQKILRVGASALSGRRKLSSKKGMVRLGLNTLAGYDRDFSRRTQAIFVAHSHYDHLMDVPAVYQALEQKPMVYMNESGQNLCHAVIDSAHLELLERHSSSFECARAPIDVGTHMRVYPIVARHNPHANFIKFFDGSLGKQVSHFRDPYDKTRANDWLEGITYSFLIDYLDDDKNIQLRIFIQSSSCPPDAGTPPPSLIGDRKVDVAFLCVASYAASPMYPERLLQHIEPAKIVWIHWEDFFRSYAKTKPKTVRGTNVPGFFQKKVVADYLDRSYLPWPRKKLSIHY